jgi:hypothetical protein
MRPTGSDGNLASNLAATGAGEAKFHRERFLDLSNVRRTHGKIALIPVKSQKSTNAG